MKRSKLIIISLVVMNIILLAFHIKPMMKRFGKPMDAIEQISSRLNFSVEQIASLQTLFKEHKETSRLILDQIHRKKRDLFSRLDITDTERDSIAQHIGHLQGGLDNITHRHMAAIRKLCTDSQRKEFDTMIEGLLRDMKGRKPPGKRPPPPRR